jgi:hypothetical protein
VEAHPDAVEAHPGTVEAHPEYFELISSKLNLIVH